MGEIFEESTAINISQLVLSVINSLFFKHEIFRRVSDMFSLCSLSVKESYQRVCICQIYSRPLFL